jgi:uncharacterized protein
MTTTTLALIIFTVILVQLSLVILIGIYRSRQNLLKSSAQDTKSRTTTNTTTVNPLVTLATSSDNSWKDYREFSVQRREFEDNEQSICSYYLVPVDGKSLQSFIPGQFLTFKLQINDPASNELKSVIRCYSLSDAPQPDYYRVSIKRVSAPAAQPDLPDGIASSFFHNHIQQGSQLLVKPPSGHFHIMQDTALPIVLIGGGIGITPMLSILNTLLQQASNREIWLYYGVQNSDSHIMKQHFSTLAERHANFHLHVCYSKPKDTDQPEIDYQHQGRIDIPLLRNTLKLMRYQFYICGPGPMMQSMVTGLHDWGVESEDIYYEAFGPSSISKKEKTQTQQAEMLPANITFCKSGKSISWDSSYDSLLEFAEDNHIEIESGCRSGSCGSCQTPVKSGDLDLMQEPDFDIPPGHCLMCISTPRGNLTLDA